MKIKSKLVVCNKTHTFVFGGLSMSRLDPINYIIHMSLTPGIGYIICTSYLSLYESKEPNCILELQKETIPFTILPFQQSDNDAYYIPVGARPLSVAFPVIKLLNLIMRDQRASLKFRLLKNNTFFMFLLCFDR